MGDVTILERGMLAEREMLQSSKEECWRSVRYCNPQKKNAGGAVNIAAFNRGMLAEREMIQSSKRNTGGEDDIVILKRGMLAEREILRSSTEECWRSGR